MLDRFLLMEHRGILIWAVITMAAVGSWPNSILTTMRMKMGFAKPPVTTRDTHLLALNIVSNHLFTIFFY
jgi:hypothetical protein